MGTIRHRPGVMTVGYEIEHAKELQKKRQLLVRTLTALAQKAWFWYRYPLHYLDSVQHHSFQNHRIRLEQIKLQLKEFNEIEEKIFSDSQYSLKSYMLVEDKSFFQTCKVCGRQFQTKKSMTKLCELHRSKKEIQKRSREKIKLKR